MNWKLTVGLVVVFVALLAYAVFVQRPKDLAAEVTPTTRATSYVWTTSADQITGFRIEDRVNQTAVAVASDGAGGWTLTEPGPQPADPTKVSTTAGSLAALTVAATVTSTTDLTPFGVLSPTYQLDVTLADGSHLTAAVGDKTPTGTAYYVLAGGSPNVVTVASAFMDPVLALLTDPPLPPTATPAATVTGTVSAEGTPAGNLTATPAVTATP